MEKTNKITVEKKRLGVENVARKTILPTEINDLDDNVIVIVNRTRLNSRLAGLIYQDDDIECKAIIHVAVKKMINEEKENNRISIGPKMKVSEVKKIFPELENMPKNSFALI